MLFLQWDFRVALLYLWVKWSLWWTCRDFPISICKINCSVISNFFSVSWFLPMTRALLFWQTSGNDTPFVFLINLYLKWCIRFLAWLELVLSHCLKYSAAESRPRLQPPAPDIRPVLEVEGLSGKFVTRNTVTNWNYQTLPILTDIVVVF